MRWSAHFWRGWAAAGVFGMAEYFASNRPFAAATTRRERTRPYFELAFSVSHGFQMNERIYGSEF
jgi:hypothetical protein